MSNQTKNSETLSWVCLGVGVVSWLFNPFALLSILGIFLYVYTRSTYGVKNIKLTAGGLLSGIALLFFILAILKIVGW
ncbi:hypothetical protein [Dubosiella muris]|uniref:Uncharacterized protein n=1 Tax=Dubosiella muris TaxID=3038133 RepID=A0AC61R8X4_9FIRM|nr:hypothetical protein [Dubosiella muris]TGY66014.1 hypothetical protein E5336_05870 [Dubosiella muris]